MKEFKINRESFTTKSSIGRLFLPDGKVHCYTLEDVDRHLESGGTKVDKQTAIPKGRYELIIDMSTRFKRLMPHILSVPHFEGIRMHKGQTAEDTEGCPLLGANLGPGPDKISNCQGVFDSFFETLKSFLADEKCYIIVS